MRVGLVCPYTWDVPGGVQSHVHDLALTLRELGHEVSVLAPADDDAELPDWVVPSGKPVPVPYNGSVARLTFGPVSAARARRWLRDGEFDVVHIHEPLAPSVSILTLWAARGPVVATFHASVERSRALRTVQPALQPALEKIHARIAVSPAARRYVVEHVGGACLLIPNGVAVARFAAAPPLEDVADPGSETVGFLGRIDEPRKGLHVLLDAIRLLDRPGLRLLVAGPGEMEVDDPRVTLLGRLGDDEKVRFLRTLDVYCAPNTGGESFGIVLLEAMAAGAAVVASDLDAFERVLAGTGVIVPSEDARALAAAIERLLDDPALRADLARRAREEVARYDWPVVARAIVDVYETVAGEKVTTTIRP